MMTHVFISAANTGRYHKLLTMKDYRVSFINCPMTGEDLEPVKKILEDEDRVFLVLDVQAESLQLLAGLDPGEFSGITVLGLSDTITGETKALLLDAGIIDLLEGNRIERVMAFLENQRIPGNILQRRIAVVDDNPVIRGILSRLLNRFGFKPVFEEGIDGLLEIIEKHPFQMALINLGTGNLNVGKLIRSSLVNTKIKKLPVITYKDMNAGLYVHEIINGLNRITRVVLSPEELYSFLLDILYRVSIVPLVKGLNNLVKFNDNIICDSGDLSRIFHTMETDPYNMENILSGENIHDILERLHRIRKIMDSTESLKWLKIEQDRNVSTCGVSGKN